MEEQILIFFKLLNAAIREKDEILFGQCWNKNSYHRSFSGPEAISGANLYLELTDNDLYLAADSSEFQHHEYGYLLLGSFIKSHSNADADYIYLLVRVQDESIRIEALSRSRLEIEAIIDNKNSVPFNQSISENQAEAKLTDEDYLIQYFRELNASLNQNAESKFAESWIEKAFYYNLSGEGGLSGKELYTIASNAAWQLNPITELSSFFENPEAILVHLSIWLKALEMEKPGEEGLVLLIINNGQLKILGYGTDMSAMRHLYLKYKEGAVL